MSGTPASSSGAKSASRGAIRSSRACSFASRASAGKLVPRAHRQAIIAAINAVAHRLRGIHGRYGPCARWSDRKCSAAHPAGRAREMPRSGRYRDRPGRSRNDRSPARPGRSPSVRIAPRKNQDPMIPRHQICVLALPAKARPVGPAVFPSTAPYRQKLSRPPR